MPVPLPNSQEAVDLLNDLWMVGGHYFAEDDFQVRRLKRMADAAFAALPEEFVQVPTSLLAAVDSSVGGKVAVNFGGVKNIMGVFAQPQLVFCDLDTLLTFRELPACGVREVRSGASEIIKYGAVCSRALFEQLESGALERLLALDPATLVDVVAQCVALKARVVEQDEFDKMGIRNVLNFGHTIGHALELSAANYGITDPHAHPNRQQQRTVGEQALTAGHGAPRVSMSAPFERAWKGHSSHSGEVLDGPRLRYAGALRERVTGIEPA